MAGKSIQSTSPVLVAVDFSADSEKALLWAAAIAERLTVPLTVVHVVHDPESAPGYYRRSEKHGKHLMRMEDVAAEMMSDFLTRLRREHPELSALASADERLVIGLPVTRILEVAEESKARLIVMGSKGRTGLPHMLLGSKAEKVAQLSPIPVTIVKDTKTTSAARTGDED